MIEMIERLFQTLVPVALCLTILVAVSGKCLHADSLDRDPIDGFTYLDSIPARPQSGIPLESLQYEYQSGDLTVRCEIIFPPDPHEIPLPTIVLCHGGVSGVTDRGRIRACKLAEDGFLVVMPSYRGEDGSDGLIEIAGGEVDDVLACIDLLREISIVDPDRIILIGTSHGALIAALAAAKDPDLQAVVCAYGVMDIIRWWHYLNETNQYEEDEITRRIYGDGPDDRPENFNIRQAIRYACDMQPPTFIIQGETDTIVPPEQAEALVDAFESCEKSNYTYTEYPGVGHGFLLWHEGDRERRGDEGLELTSRAWEDIMEFIHNCRDGEFESIT